MGIVMLCQKVNLKNISSFMYNSDSMEEDCDDKDMSSDDENTIKLSKDEIKLMNRYTWDKEPKRAWRHNSDYRVLRECTEYRWFEICKFFGKFSGFSSSVYLYRNPSKCCNMIETLICPNKCYFRPEKCFLKHGSSLKSLMKESLHVEQGPEFRALFDAPSKPDLKIEHDVIGRPKFDKLAEEIGFDTKLEYDEEGFLKVDYSVLDEKTYDQKRPSFIVEEKKILDIIHALLICSHKKQCEEMDEANQMFSQSLPGLNDPILKTMCFGPFPEFDQNNENIECNLAEDEKKVFMDNNVKHSHCLYFKNDMHWRFKHDDNASTKECTMNENITLDGPATAIDSQIIYYPCNFLHCWKPCECKFCTSAQVAVCKNHKEHVKFHIKKCIVQESVQCQEHWVNHPENFNEAEDIIVDKKVLFHKDSLLKNGRNYNFESVKFAGLKVNCKKCRENTNDHLKNHLTFHMQCKHCIYEGSVIFDKSFWNKVCNVCGKLFKTVNARLLHIKRYNVPIQICDLCQVECSSKYNLTRHMIEQHSMTYEHLFRIETKEEAYKCYECQASFRYKRNLVMHIKTIHEERQQFKCELCKQVLQTRWTLRRHLEEQHEIFNLEDVISSEAKKIFSCELCELEFSRKENLERHMGTHASSSSSKHTCTDCGKQFTTNFSLSRHQVVHASDRERLHCNICDKTFSTTGNLARHMDGVHKKQ